MAWSSHPGAIRALLFLRRHGIIMLQLEKTNSGKRWGKYPATTHLHAIKKSVMGKVANPRSLQAHVVQAVAHRTTGTAIRRAHLHSGKRPRINPATTYTKKRMAGLAIVKVVNPWRLASHLVQAVTHRTAEIAHHLNNDQCRTHPSHLVQAMTHRTTEIQQPLNNEWLNHPYLPSGRFEMLKVVCPRSLQSQSGFVQSRSPVSSVPDLHPKRRS